MRDENADAAEASGESASGSDDDTYAFTGEPEAPDGTATDLSMSDEEIDRIFKFDVDEIMKEDEGKAE